MAKNNFKEKATKKTSKNPKIGQAKISPAAVELRNGNSTDHLNALFSFCDSCPNHFQLSEWQSTELKSLVDTFKNMGKRPWSELKADRGLQIKMVDPKYFSKKLPDFISQDVTIHELRVSKRARIFGHRTGNVFNIIWFDRNHDVYKMS